MKQLIIIGTGGFAREVYWLAKNAIGYGEDFVLKGFVEGDAPVSEERNKLLPDKFFGSIVEYEIQADDVFVIAIANGDVKEKLASIVTAKGGHFINLIHKTAQIAPTAQLGTDVILCQFTFVSDLVKIGNHVMLNVATGVGHDAVIGDYSSLMGGVAICGGVQVGTHTFWATGAMGVPHSIIEDHATVGAHSVVLRRVRKGRTVFGNPAVYID